jgi:hypothetical protein
VSPVKYEHGLFIPEDDILHSHLRENLKSYVLSPSSRLENGDNTFSETSGRASATKHQVHEDIFN